MPDRITYVSLAYALFRGQLALRRTPKYLRFVCKDVASCSRNWDALDQVDDQPEEGEYLFAGVLKHRGSLHVDRTVRGRRVGEWHATATYELISPQPEQDVMQDPERWKAWCYEQEASPVAADASQRNPEKGARQ